ncbi:hypothetical protein [Rossellomorea marisflavi]|uniref:hypothetical protein n=1 Tax=Rossellomorea marisflavi TaxID=189381 RepID=UPI00345CBE91
MNIVEGKYYANDHINLNGIKVTNVIKVISPGGNLRPEYNDPFHVTETMSLEDGEFDSLIKMDWYEAYLEREATTDEAKKFEKYRKEVNNLKHRAEEVTGHWIK